MRAEYKRDMNHNYLILHGDKEIDTSSYQVRMLVGNAIPSLLKCRVQGIDGKFMVYYDVTSRQPVSTLYEQRKFGMEDLRLIFGGFVQVMEEMSEYLLNPGELVIRPEYMYLDVEKKEMFFCYLPGFQQDVREQFQALTEYVLPKLDHEDGKAVMLGYGVYRRALEDSFHLEHIKEELYHVQDKTSEGRDVFLKQPEAMDKASETDADEREIAPDWAREAPIGADYSIHERERDSVQAESDFLRHDDTKKSKTKNKKRNTKKEAGNKYSVRDRDDKGENQLKNDLLKKIGGCAAGTCILMGIIFAKLMGYLPGIQMQSILGAVLVCMGVGMLAYKIYTSKKEGSGKGNSAQGSQRQSYKGDENQDSRWEDMEKGYLYRRDSDLEEGDIGDSYKKILNNSKNNSPDTFSRQEPPPDGFGETVILSENPVAGPASLVSREPGELATIFLKEDLTVIGKLETAADAVINLPTVSRVHAKIRKKDGAYYLSDLNSRNGTSVNGRILKSEE